MTGGTEVSLKKLLVELGIKSVLDVDFFVEKYTENVESSDEDLLTVSKDENDYIISIPVKRGKDINGREASFSIEQTNGDKIQVSIAISGKHEVDLGTAIISPADDKYLPDDVIGHAEEIDGKSAIKKVKKYTKSDDDQIVYSVFDIALDDVNISDYAEGFDVQVELPYKIYGKDFHLYHIHEGKVEELDVEKSIEKTEGSIKDKKRVADKDVEVLSGFSFITDSFSEFVLSYTVDFSYSLNGKIYEYSLPGGSKITLSDLVNALDVLDTKVYGRDGYKNINAFLNDVANVEFSTPEYVSVEKVLGNTNYQVITPDTSGQDQILRTQEENKKYIPADDKDVNWTTVNVKEGDYLLNSLKPFKTEEILTITMNSGEEIVLKVTDAQNADGTWHLNDNTTTFTVSTQSETNDISHSASLDVDFSYTLTQTALQELKALAQTGEDPVLKYDFSSALMKDGKKIADVADVAKGSLRVGNREVGYYSIVDGVLTMTITSKSWLLGRTTLSGQFGFSIVMDADNTKDDDGETFEFPGAGDIDVTFKKKTEEGTKSVYGTKNDDGSWTLYYTANLQVNQPLDSLAFTDTYSNEQTLVSGSVKVDGQSVNISSTDNGFTISDSDFRSAINRVDGQIPAKTYQITYSTTVSAETLFKQEIQEGEPTSTTETNTASWTVDGENNHPGGETEYEIPYEVPEPPSTPFGKTSTPASNTTLSNAGEEITYVIEVGDSETSLNGLHVTDSMTDLQTLNEGKVYIAYGSPENTRTEMPSNSVKWVNDDNYSNNSLQVFDYTFTTEQNGPAYIIYTTTTITQEKATEKGIYGTQTVQNHANLVNDNKWSSTQHQIPLKEQERVPVTKNASVSGEDLTTKGNWEPGATVSYKITIGTKDGDEPTNLNNMHVYDNMQDLQTLDASSISLVIRHADGSTTSVTNVVKDGNTVPVSQVINSEATDNHYSTNWVSAFDFYLPSNVGEGQLEITYTTTIMDQEAATAIGAYGNVSIGNTGYGGNGSDGTSGTGEYEPEPEMTVSKLVDGVESKTLSSIETEDDRTVTYTVTYGYDKIKKMDGVVIMDEMTDIQKLVLDENGNADITIEVMQRPEADLTDSNGNVLLSLNDWDAGSHTFKMPMATAMWNQDGYSWPYFDDDSYSEDQNVRVYYYALPNGLGVNQVKVTFQAEMISQDEANDNSISGSQHAKNKGFAGNQSDETDITVPFEEEVTHKGDIDKSFSHWDVENNRMYWTIRVFKRSDSAYPLENVTISEYPNGAYGSNSEGESLSIPPMQFWTSLYDGNDLYRDIYTGGIDLSIADVAHAVIVTDSGVTLQAGTDYDVNKQNASFHFNTLDEGITITLPMDSPINLSTGQQQNIINTFYAHNVARIDTEENWDLDDADATYNETKVEASKNSKYDAEKRIITYEVHLNRAGVSLPEDVDVIFSDLLDEGLTLLNWDTEESENPTVLFQVYSATTPLINNQSHHEGAGNVASTEVTLDGQKINDINLSDLARNNDLAGNPNLQLNGHHFVVYYKVSVADDWEEITSSETGYKDYENTATFTAGDKDYSGHTTTRVSADEVIKKYDTTLEENGFVVNEDGQRSNEITYKVDINKNRERLNSEDNPYVQLTDRIDTNMDLNTGSVKVVKVAENGDETDITNDVAISYNDNTRILSLERIPDREYIILTFSAYTRAQGTDTFSNTATVIGGGSHSSSVSKEHSISTSYAGLSAGNLVMNLNKINQNRITEKIPGAEFKLYEVVWEENPLANGYDLLNRLMSDWKEANYFDKPGKDYSYIAEAFKIRRLDEIKTNAVESEHGKGTVYITDPEGYIDWSDYLQDFHVYMWEEVYAPEGYTGILNDPHYFIVYPENGVDSGTYSKTNFPWASDNEYIAQSIAWALDNATQMSNQNGDGSNIVVASLASGTTWTATNISSDKTYIEGTKDWEGDSDDLFDTRPKKGITLQLWRMKQDGSEKEKVGIPIPINADPDTGDWPSYVWNNLDRFYEEEINGVQVAKLWKYYIVEEEVPGYTTSYSDDGEGVNEGNITITNKLIPSNVDISVKKAFDPDGDDKPSQIIVELWRINTPVGGEASEPEFTGITTALTHSNNWQDTFKNLPTRSENGTYTYTVKERQTAEIARFNYTVIYSDNGEGVFDTEEGPLTITNTQSGNLKVTKTITGLENGDELTDEQKTAITFSVTNEEGEEVSSFTLSDMGPTMTKTLDNLPVGLYTVTETVPSESVPEDYTLKSVTYSVENGETEVVNGDTAAITITNTYEAPQNGALTVNKVVVGGDTNKEFSFTVTLSDTSINGTYGGMEFEQGVASFTLRHNESKAATDLPVGITYIVEEMSSDGYTTAKTGNTGKIESGETARANFVNTYRATGALDLSAAKIFSNGNLGDTSFTFKLTQVTADKSTTPVKSSDVGSGEGKRPSLKLETTESKTTTATSGTTDTVDFSQITFTKNDTVDETGEYWFLLEEDVPTGIDANGVKDGIKYDTTKKWIKVTVADDGEGNLTVTKDPGTTSGTSDATFTNEKLGSLKIVKTYQGLPDGHPSATEAAQITFTITAPNGNQTDITYADFTNGEYVIGNALPVGEDQVYTVTETNGNVITGYDLSPESTTYGSGTPQVDGSTITLSNIYVELEDIKITKTWSDGKDGHSGHTVSYNVHQKAYNMDDTSVTDPVSESIVRKGTITAPDWAAEEKDLPVTGVHDNGDGTFTHVRFEYDVSEEYFPGYEATVTGKGTGTQPFSILNTKLSDDDLTTTIGIEKLWKNRNGDAVDPPENLTKVDVTLTQVVLDTEYVPVTIAYKDGAGRQSGDIIRLYVKKGDSLIFNNIGVPTSTAHTYNLVQNASNVAVESRSTSATTGTITEPSDLVFELNYNIPATLFGFTLWTAYDEWAPNNGTGLTGLGWNKPTTPSASSSGAPVYSSLADLAAAASSVTSLTRTENTSVTVTVNVNKTDSKWYGERTGLARTSTDSDGSKLVYLYYATETDVDGTKWIPSYSIGDSKENAVSGHTETAETDDIVITNTEIETITLEGTKIWDILSNVLPADPTLTLTRTVTKEVEGETITTDPETVNVAPVWSDGADTKTRKFKYSDLPKYDNEGNEYTYTITEASFTVDGKIYNISKTGDDYVVKDANNNIVKSFVVTQTENNITNTEKKEFSFTKEWYGVDPTAIPWPTDSEDNDIPISVTITGKKTGSEDVVITQQLTSATPAANAGYTLTSSGNSYTFTFTGLDKDYEYQVTEATIDGYHIEYYLKGSSEKQDSGIDWTKDGGVIKNVLITVELPYTGGIGTKLLYTLGSILVFLSGALLLIKRRRLTPIRLKSDGYSNYTSQGSDRSTRGGGGRI